MTVHVGQITSEIDAASAPSGIGATTGGPAGGETDEWEERVRLAALLERLDRDRMRTDTGVGHD